LERDALKEDSDIMLDQTRTIDNRRLKADPLTVLTDRELAVVETYWRIVLGLD
jgi:mRNA-degrading endonuclease toxin of MazEF toxin-antitoxin module